MVLRILVAVLVAAGLAACAGDQSVVTTGERQVVLPGMEDVSTPAELIAKVDWSEPESRVLRIRQGEFTPVVMSFRPGVPYVLRIENQDDSVRFFRAADFFKAIAVKSVTPAEAGFPTEEGLVSVKLEPGKTSELAFVPFREGYYSFDDAALGLSFGGGRLALPSMGMFGSNGAIFIE